MGLKKTSVSVWPTDLATFNSLRAIETGKRKRTVDSAEMFHEILETHIKKEV